jgi:hypothetical protein
VVRAGVVELAGVVAVDAQPVHLAPAHHLVLAHDRRVVLSAQATTQALQAMHEERSTVIPHA